MTTETRYEMIDLTALAVECACVVRRAETALGPLSKASYLDLCADNINASLSDIRYALAHAGVGYHLLTPTGDAHRDRLVSARLKLRRA